MLLHDTADCPKDFIWVTVIALKEKLKPKKCSDHGAIIITHIQQR